jgi:hypothetical protein
MRHASALLLVTFFGLSMALGPQASKCVSCCPTPRDDVPALSNLACCGEGCGEKLASGQESPCLTSGGTALARSQAMLVIPTPATSLDAGSFDPVHATFWLPARARPGSVPRRC